MHGLHRDPAPALIIGDQGLYACPLCRTAPEHHTLGDHSSFVCPDCAIYWCEAAVIRGDHGIWDDSGVQCSSTRVPNITVTSVPGRLPCVLGIGHADASGRPTDHLAMGGFRWAAETASSEAP